ncbi:hypothetical protein CNMCM8980_001363 [Aspergillus fumigatiaffinis]|uniref:LPXTG-domain-containing protein n=1 Tax=Aspergillus fumigatiaffinis TaxID=340414 RepID=A0A8H4GJL8_9EURO|nr:hypothetical protein CNMCM5878_009081 [Aspergillus fumigatiaffinis]KAF4223280.1 hypothetical protein CNMCM6457_000544 [Aspergillus fumigatiaffinis]KAF4234906.1 hypothetical protein CNMCM6805_008379 [Aspergillus fumigatiaffinis]KAF4240287.1 hypothetical protein CNMCM8980_001363 [Aspergillus fumigatiaffinis]
MAKLVALGLLLWAIPALAVIATVNSPCLSICGGTDKTVDDELICNDGDYNSTVKGLTMKNCLLCESTSTTYSNQFNSDIYWFIFNQKYTIQVCVYADTASTSLSPCESQCLPLKPVFRTLWWGHNVSLYNYCTQNSNAFPTYASGCSECLRGKAGSKVLGNFMDNMASACETQPNATKGETVTLARPLFDLSVATNSTATSTAATTATGTGTSTSSPTSTASSSSGLSAGAAAGIGVGAGAGVILVGALVWVLFRRRRRAAQQSQMYPPAAPGGHDYAQPMQQEASYATGYPVERDPSRLVEAPDSNEQKPAGTWAAELPSNH